MDTNTIKLTGRQGQLNKMFYGIMTLSRGPCDLDNMSLFQDLKLKRRKVDSRCSSDGESAADTSTSSPDPGPPSPRMAEAGCSTPPHPPPVFDGGGSPTPSPACHPTVIRSAPPYSVIKFESSPASVKAECSPASNKPDATPPQLSSVKLEGTPEPPQPYRPRALAPPPPGSHTSLSPGPWPPAACINGVKPELIGGHFPPQPLEPKPGARGSTQWRGTPAVIMGESGGVRTMFWTLPAPTSSGEPAASASHTPTPPTPDPATCSEESAARLLLNLGGELRRPRGPPLNMELLWAGDVSQLPAHQQLTALNLSAAAGSVAGASQVAGASALALPRPELRAYAPEAERDEDEQPMICMICEDKATGLHYGIITCEGCKGFFKRTVQNRRVYTCVADGGCEITKAQRNRCQYCRFKKCIEQGMVLQAVREDRMPGGRNSGAVYNLYKVKYKKHKKANKAATTTSRASPPEKPKDPLPPIPSHLVNGTILKTALTNPSEVVHLRARLESAVSSSRDRAVPLERALHMIRALIDCDAMEDIATVRHLPDLLHDTSEIGDKLCKIGDSIVHKMVAWTKKLPFIMEIPMEIHSKLLMEKWHEISVLTTAAYQAMHGKHAHAPPSSDHEQDFMQEVNANLRTLQNCLTSLMGRPITLEQLRLDVGLVVEKMTQITCVFRRIQLRMEEYVCLKVYILLNQEVELEGIQDRYVQVLRSYLEHAAPHHPGRLQELFARIPEIQAAANLLLESKMFYVPFVLNSAEIR
ncbi:hormone receptor 4 isoform X1 [Helicoverpa armigera]|uniref:hormone receptor 4 isoform X1 n=2 Tax=Helicoverpa armigera TaxID=29058 RepID=UPI002113567C|nr:hormone receptor 4 isoform X1 [Helicoverpa armigera]